MQYKGLTQYGACGYSRPRLGHRGGFTVTNYEVVKQANIDQLQCCFEPPGDAFVRLAGLCHTRRMIVRQDNGRRVGGQRLLHHFPGVYAGAVDGAAKHLIEAQHAMAIVEIQAAEQLVTEMADSGLQIGLSIRRTPYSLARRQGSFEITPRQLRQGVNERRSGCADTLFGHQCRGVGMQQLTQPAEAVQQLPRQVACRILAIAAMK